MKRCHWYIIKSLRAAYMVEYEFLQKLNQVYRDEYICI